MTAPRSALNTGKTGAAQPLASDTLPAPVSQSLRAHLARLSASGAFWATIIFFVALVTRLLFASVPLDIDEGMWIRRGPLFVLALLRGDWPGTYLRHHPGVTNMWLTGGALTLRYALHGLLGSTPAAQPAAGLPAYLASVGNALPGAPLWAYTTARAVFALVTAGCLAGTYLLSRRLFGPAVALISATILLFEPFFVAYQRSITTDANETNFTWLALLAFLLYGRAVLAGERRWGWLLLSGVCYGLALLSKVSALLSLPVFGLWFAWIAWSLRGPQLRALLPRLVAQLAAWGAVTAAIVLLAWPALWTDAAGTVARMATDLGDEVDGHYQFFLGQTTLAPGAGFYPVVLLFRLSPLLLLAGGLGIVCLALPRTRRYMSYPAGMWAVLANVVIVLLGLTSRASKIDRYIVPVIPGLALLAAAGIWACVLAFAARRGRQPATFGRPAVLWGTLAVVAVAQLVVFLPHYPTLLTYFNPLVGGARGAESAVMVGNGELLNRAADWLNRQPGAALGTAASWYTGSFAPYYQGKTVELTRDPGTGRWSLADAQYAVLYVNQFQRRQPPEVLHYYAPQRPLYVAQDHGVDYALVYPGPSPTAEEVQAPAVQPVGLDFGGYARLLGYDLQTPDVPAGGTAVLTLYWQALAPFPANDYTVYAGVRGAAGQLYGKADNEPAGGMVPVGEWQAGRVIRDAQQVRVLPGTPPGDYRVEIGFYSQQLGQMLPIRDAGGSRGTQVPLATVHVTRPVPPTGASEADLGIGHVLPASSMAAAGSARLVGYDWAERPSFQAGDAIPLTLLWRAGTTPSADTEVYLELSDGRQTWRRVHGHQLGGSYPANGWSPGELVRDSWEALLPADIPAGRYRLTVVADGPNGQAPLVDLGDVQLETQAHSFGVPRPEVTQPVELGNVARLAGYDLPVRTAPGAPAALTLYWQPLGEADRKYARFVHLLGPHDQILAQADGQPGAAPITSWVAGESIADQVTLSVPGDLADGTYQIAVGLYDPGDGRRLKDPGGADHIILSGPLQVRRGTP